MAHRKGRSVLTGSGIVLGVAILFGVLVANATTQAGFDDLLESWTGRADVVASPVGVFESTLPAHTLERLRALPGVRDAVGTYGFGASIPRPKDMRAGRFEDDDTIGLFLTTFTDASQKIRDYELERGRLPRADEVMVPAKLATDAHLRVGNAVHVKGKAGTADLTISGILKEGRAGGFMDGGFQVYAPDATVRSLAGVGPDVFGGVSLILYPGTEVNPWIDRHQDTIAGVRLENAEELAAGFKQFLVVFGTFLTFFAGITLFIGAFLIYLTLSMAVIERTRMYGTLRALGATRRQVRRVVLLEAVALGVVSTIIGLFVGLGLASVLLRLISSLFNIEMPGLVITPAAAIAAVVTGLVVTALSSLIPARRAGRLAPVEAMKGDHARDTHLSRMWVVGAILMALGIGVQAASSGSGSNVGSIGVIGMLFGAVLLTPLLLRPLASLLGRLTSRLSPGVGSVAVLHLSKERSRSAYTLALIMVVMAMLFATGGLYLSVRASVDEIVDRQFGADLFVESRPRPSAELGRELSRRRDIAAISPVRFGETSAIAKDGHREFLFVQTIEPDSYFGVSSFFWKRGQGDDDSAKRALDAGGNVVVSDLVARELGVQKNDTLLVQTRKGKVPFHVAAVYITDPGPPRIAIGIKDGRRYFAAAEPFAYLARVPRGTNASAVAGRLERDLGERVNVQTAAETKEAARSQVSTYFQIVYAILLVAAIVGLLGLANTLAMSVLQRFREIGILRAIGVTRSQMWRMVLVESATMGLAAFVLSVPLGWLLARLVIAGTSAGFGFTIPTVYPWLWIPGVAAFGLGVAVIAAIAPGRRASRLEVVSALQYE